MNRPVARRRFRLQFSVRSLLILTAVVGVVVAYYASRPARQHRAVSAFTERGGTIGYSNGEPNQLERLLGEEYGGTVDYADLFGTDVGDAEVAFLEALPDVRQLRLPGTRVTDKGLRHLQGLRAIEWIDLHTTDVSDSGMQHLRDLRTLKQLHVTNTKVGDDGLAHLSGLENLEELGLGGTRITDAGMQHLISLNSLKSLDLGNTAISDQGLQVVAQLESLRTLILRGRTNVTDGGIQNLQEKRPDVRVFR